MDAKVICRMLGFDPTSSVATVQSAFGAVSNHFILDDVRCEGEETNILLCTHSKRENCGPTEGAGVVCESSGLRIYPQISWYINIISFSPILGHF